MVLYEVLHNGNIFIRDEIGLATSGFNHVKDPRGDFQYSADTECSIHVSADCNCAVGTYQAGICLFARGNNLDIETGKNALNYFLALPTPPTAIVCANDMIAHGILVRAQELHVEVPTDLSVIGFDGVSSPLFTTPLTTVQQDIPKIAQMLIDLCLHPKEEAQTITIPTQFISGSTCCYYRKNKNYL